MGNKLLTPSITHKYPTYRDNVIKNGHTWLAGRRKDENAEGLWRIYDNLYNLENFAEIHPGGEEWLKLTKGCDITEAFESHHVSGKPEKLLQYYFIRKAKEPRNSKLTFDENGFYKTLKRRVCSKMPTIDRRVELKSKIIQDLLLIITLALTAYVGKTNSILLCLLCGIFLAFTSITSHNFFHKRNNWRMKIFNLSFMSYRDWRISHALSHHQFPNSLLDLEISYLEPFLLHLVYTDKTSIQKYVSWAYSWIIYSVFYLSEVVKRTAFCIYRKKNFWHLDEIVIPLIIPATVYYFGTGQTIKTTLFLYFWIMFFSSLLFGFIGVNGAHHTTQVFHDGDPLRHDLDFGKFQIDSITERTSLKKNLFLVLTHFGDHALHHLFPTLDHAILPYFNDIFIETCKEFNIEPEESSWQNVISSQFLQLTRVQPKNLPLGSQFNNNNGVQKDTKKDS